MFKLIFFILLIVLVLSLAFAISVKTTTPDMPEMVVVGSPLFVSIK